MRESSTDQSILELLAMTILADKQIYAAEIKAFTHSVLKLQDEGVLSTKYSEARVILWYETHKDDLADQLSYSKFEDWINHKISNLSSLTDKLLVLDAIEFISKSDGEEHISEKALLILASRICDSLVAA